MLDLVQHCLSVVPCPGLSASLAIFRLIWSSIQQVQASRTQLVVLANCISQLLSTLDTEYREERLVEGNTSAALDGLTKYVLFQLKVLSLPFTYRLQQTTEGNIRFHPEAGHLQLYQASLHKGSQDRANRWLSSPDFHLSVRFPGVSPSLVLSEQ